MQADYEATPDGLYDDLVLGARVSIEGGCVVAFRDSAHLELDWLNMQWRKPWGFYPDVVRDMGHETGGEG